MTTKETKDTTTHNAPKHDRDVPTAGTGLPASAVPLPAVSLPLYLADAVREYGQQVPVMETQETKDAPKPPPPPPPVEVYLATDVQAQLRAPDRWKATVLLALVTAGIYLPVHDDDPRRALNDLLVNNALPLPHEIPVEPIADEHESRRR